MTWLTRSKAPEIMIILFEEGQRNDLCVSDLLERLPGSDSTVNARLKELQASSLIFSEWQPTRTAKGNSTRRRILKLTDNGLKIAKHLSSIEKINQSEKSGADHD